MLGLAAQARYDDTNKSRGLTGQNPALTPAAQLYLVATDDRMMPPVAQRSMAEHTGAKVMDSPAATRSTSPDHRP
jgi:hypothetical protein